MFIFPLRVVHLLPVIRQKTGRAYPQHCRFKSLSEGCKFILYPLGEGKKHNINFIQDSNSGPQYGD